MRYYYIHKFLQICVAALSLYLLVIDTRLCGHTPVDKLLNSPANPCAERLVNILLGPKADKVAPATLAPVVVEHGTSTEKTTVQDTTVEPSAATTKSARMKRDVESAAVALESTVTHQPPPTHAPVVEEVTAAGRPPPAPLSPAKARQVTMRSHSCIDVYQLDLFGVGHPLIGDRLARLRIPAIMLLIEIVYLIFNMGSVFQKTAPPNRCYDGSINLVHATLWMFVGVPMLFMHSEWHDAWMVSSSNLIPAFPAKWQAVQIIAALSVFVYALETIFNKYLYVNVYMERTFGSYEVVHPIDEGYRIPFDHRQNPFAHDEF